MRLSSVKGKLEDQSCMKARCSVEAPVCADSTERTSHHLRSSSMEEGRSRYERHRLEKRDMVAPSMMRWSADQLTLITWALTRLPSASKLGRIWGRDEGVKWERWGIRNGQGNKWGTRKMYKRRTIKENIKTHLTLMLCSFFCSQFWTGPFHSIINPH